MTKYTWKYIATGEINQDIQALSKDILFEQAGFGAVMVDEPIKGFVAIPVVLEAGEWVETQGE